MSTPTVHTHPRRAKRAKLIAIGILLGGLLALVVGMVNVFEGDLTNPILTSLIVLGPTAMILSPIWYFSYMEALEPELYEHDA